MAVTFDPLGTDAKPYALGLRWRDLSERSELKRVVADAGGRSGVVLESAGRLMVGIATGDSPALNRTSAAALLALSQPVNRLVFAHGSADQLWVCGVHSGGVDDRTDVLVGPESAERLITEIIEEARSLGEEVRVVLSDAQDLEQYFRWYGTAEQLRFGELIDPGLSAKAKVRSLGSGLPLSSILLWATVACVGGGMYWYKQMRDRRSGGEAATAMDPAEAARLREERILAVVSQALQQDAATPPINAGVEVCRARLGSILGYTGGWTAQKGTCGPGIVRLTLQRPSAVATIGKGVTAGKNAGAEIELGTSEAGLSWAWPTSIPVRPVPPGLPVSDLPSLQRWLQALPAHRDFLVSYYTLAQQLAYASGGQSQVGVVTPKGLQYLDPEQTAAAGQPVMAPVPSEYSYQLVTVTLTTKALGHLSGLVRKAEPLWWMSLDQIEATPAPHGWTWSVRFRALVR